MNWRKNMTPDGKQILKNVYETTDMYFRFLSLGYYFDTYAKKNDMSNSVKQINIQLGQDKGYLIDENLLKDMLDDIYQKPNQMSLFSYLVLFNTLRGVAGAIREGFGDSEDKCSSGQKEIRTKFREDIFDGNVDAFESFDGIIRLIRNVSSHNIEDRICIQEDDIKGQKKYWLTKKNKSKMEFVYAYNQPDSTIKIEKYPVKCEISIDWNQVKEGKLFGDLIPSFQSFLLIEFCRNALYFLKNRYQ